MHHITRNRSISQPAWRPWEGRWRHQLMPCIQVLAASLSYIKLHYETLAAQVSGLPGRRAAPHVSGSSPKRPRPRSTRSSQVGSASSVATASLPGMSRRSSSSTSLHVCGGWGVRRRCRGGAAQAGSRCRQAGRLLDRMRQAGSRQACEAAPPPRTVQAGHPGSAAAAARLRAGRRRAPAAPAAPPDPPALRPGCAAAAAPARRPPARPRRSRAAAGRAAR